MNIRLLEYRDLDKLREIWEEFYKESFPFPVQVERKQLDRYVITNNNDKIITFGTLELGAEFIALTDKSLPVGIRREALYKLFTVLTATARFHGLPILNCSVNDPNWERHLKKVGFTEPKDKILIYKV